MRFLVTHLCAEPAWWPVGVSSVPGRLPASPFIPATCCAGCSLAEPFDLVRTRFCVYISQRPMEPNCRFGSTSLSKSPTALRWLLAWPLLSSVTLSSAGRRGVQCRHSPRSCHERRRVPCVAFSRVTVGGPRGRAGDLSGDGLSLNLPPPPQQRPPCHRASFCCSRRFLLLLEFSGLLGPCAPGPRPLPLLTVVLD